jgi:hypothetical protein
MEKTRYYSTDYTITTAQKKALHQAGCKYRTRNDGVIVVTCPEDISSDRILNNNQ